MRLSIQFNYWFELIWIKIHCYCKNNFDQIFRLLWRKKIDILIERFNLKNNDSKKKLFLYIRNESGIFNEVLYSCVKDSLVLGLERLIKNIYLFVNPNTYNFIGIILLSYYFHVNNGESFILFVACAGNNLLFKSLVVDLNTYFSYILDLYIGFILILNFTYNLISLKLFY